jgi:hypothetical protein
MNDLALYAPAIAGVFVAVMVIASARYAKRHAHDRD